MSIAHTKHTAYQDKCPHCLMSKSIRNPTGYCDHLYYPEKCWTCILREQGETLTFDGSIAGETRGLGWILKITGTRALEYLRLMYGKEADKIIEDFWEYY